MADYATARFYRLNIWLWQLSRSYFLLTKGRCAFLDERREIFPLHDWTLPFCLFWGPTAKHSYQTTTTSFHKPSFSFLLQWYRNIFNLIGPSPILRTGFQETLEVWLIRDKNDAGLHTYNETLHVSVRFFFPFLFFFFPIVLINLTATEAGFLLYAFITIK